METGYEIVALVTERQISQIHTKTHLHMNILIALSFHIVHSVWLYGQRGGVSNNPPWAPGSDKTRGQGSVRNYLQKILKRNGPYI